MAGLGQRTQVGQRLGGGHGHSLTQRWEGVCPQLVPAVTKLSGAMREPSLYLPPSACSERWTWEEAILEQSSRGPRSPRQAFVQGDEEV